MFSIYVCIFCEFENHGVCDGVLYSAPTVVSWPFGTRVLKEYFSPLAGTLDGE